MVEGLNTVCEPLSASHMHLRWHNKDAASRDLWTKTYAGAQVANSLNEIAGQDLTKVTSKHHPVYQHAIFR